MRLTECNIFRRLRLSTQVLYQLRMTVSCLPLGDKYTDKSGSSFKINNTPHNITNHQSHFVASLSHSRKRDLMAMGRLYHVFIPIVQEKEIE